MLTGVNHLLHEPGSVARELLDEAYIHLSHSAVKAAYLVAQDKDIVILRTFSKIYGMAGLRLGYSVATEKTTKLLQSWQLEDNGNMIALRCPSKEKVDALKAFGAEVIVCPTAVEPEDPRSYYSVAARLASESTTPGS